MFVHRLVTVAALCCCKRFIGGPGEGSVQCEHRARHYHAGVHLEMRRLVDVWVRDRTHTSAIWNLSTCIPSGTGAQKVFKSRSVRLSGLRTSNIVKASICWRNASSQEGNYYSNWGGYARNAARDLCSVLFTSMRAIALNVRDVRENKREPSNAKLLWEMTQESHGIDECRGISRLFETSKDDSAKALRTYLIWLSCEPSPGRDPSFGTPPPSSPPMTLLTLITSSNHSYNPLLVMLTRTS